MIGLLTEPSPEILEAAESVRQWVLDDNDGESQGMCYDATHELVRRIPGAEPFAGFFLCDLNYWEENRQQFCDHWWVRIGENILDITADQFNYRLLNEEMDYIIFGPVDELAHIYFDECP
jgi:hypothetical protein